MALDQSLGGMASLVGILLFLTTSTLILRFIARILQKNWPGMDDYLIVPAWLCFIGLATCAIYGITNRFVTFPTPTDESSLESILPSLIKTYFVADLLSTLTLGFVRLSALLFYRRVFVTTFRWDVFGTLNFILIIIVILWTLGYVLLQVFSCGSRFYELLGSQANVLCAVNPLLESVAISSFILDILVLALPVHKIWLLHTTITRKLIIMSVFLLAAAGVAASCTRMVINVISIHDREAKIQEDLFLWDTKLLYYLILEAGLCQIAVNMPSLWYLRKGVKPESILRSIRSLMSIGSDHSLRTLRKDSKDSAKDNSTIDMTREFEVTVEPNNEPTRREDFETRAQSLSG